ncbi:phosphatidylinositol glycan, class Q [Rhodotorula toruloides]|uniref:Phosphatidylinositol glycan, class Q n=1 Tax=Rhodotorula toruloides TaxID=5286 RepID=A0A511KHX2_RHOTO|nr:phosphatidylinositol glycan, class Q [Rhodotorula toruloides]
MSRRGTASLLVPDNLRQRALRTLEDSVKSSRLLHIAGRKVGEVCVATDVVEAEDVDEAETGPRQQRAANAQHGLDILGKVVCRTDAGTDGAEHTPELRFDLLDNPDLPMDASALSTSPSIILYTPLGHLEVFALSPLPLDFHPASFSRIEVDDVPPSSTRGPASPHARSSIASAIQIINVLHQDWHIAVSGASGPSAPRALHPSYALLGLATAVLRSGAHILSRRIPLIGPLSERTAFGRQLHTRFAQAASLLPMFVSLRRDLYGSASADARVQAHTAYIRFFNLVWLIANDFIIGMALASYVRDNAPLLKRLAEQLVRVYVLAYLRELLAWLSNWPMGVKLNDEIATVICRAFLFLSQLWENVFLGPVLAHLPVHIIGLCGIFGASSLLATAADLVSLLTLPFFACYVAATLVYRWSLSTLSALFNVFRGRKYNPLRSRVEPATYDVDALLLGTILFVAISFLFPTLVAFYLAFASSRLLILTVQSALLMGVSALNAFPLFALLLRFKSPRRLPGHSPSPFGWFSELM